METVGPGLLRALLFGALFDLVRDRRLAPARFVETALRALGPERDEQISAFVLVHAATALTHWCAPADAERLQGPFEVFLQARLADPACAYGLAKDALDALISVARTPEALDGLRDLADGRRRFRAGPLGQVTRWRVVERLLAVGAPDAASRLKAEIARDHTPEAGRSAFVAGAAEATSSAKADYYRRYFEDETLNEEWVSASLGAFNDPLASALTRPYLRAALERTPWIRANRRIFFLGAWITAFVRGHDTREALEIVDAYLAATPSLPLDVRRKVLEARDELERTVLIRQSSGAALA